MLESKIMIRRMVRTEDTGKIFERAGCFAFNTRYVGKYKYEDQDEDAKKLARRITPLAEMYPKCTHTAEKGSRYDFTTEDGRHISFKSTKDKGRVAPQVIGQATPKKFCELIGIDYIEENKHPILKKYIQENIKQILPIFVEYTFDCPIVYYNKRKNSIKHIELNSPILWESMDVEWSCIHSKWNNSTKLRVNGIPVLEIQFHTHRKNMAIRWEFDNFITTFNSNLRIIEFP